MDSRTIVDWLAVTYDWENIPSLSKGVEYLSVQNLLVWLGQAPDLFRQDVARYGYAIGMKATDNVTVYLSEPGSANGVHIVYPGSALTPMRTRNALMHMAAHNGKCTRIDLSVDVRDGTLTPQTLRNMYVDGRYSGRGRSWSLMEGTNGATFYIGSRSSEKYMRIYDKAAQTGTDGAWLRVELECKGDAARAGAWLVNHNGTSVIPEIINDFVKFDDPEWTDAMGNAAMSDALKGEKKMSDTRKWLLESVAKTLAREINSDPDFIHLFFEALNRHESQLRGSSSVDNDYNQP